jgi:predicted DsbA family dithiol-disulfide isomerase
MPLSRRPCAAMARSPRAGMISFLSLNFADTSKHMRVIFSFSLAASFLSMVLGTLTACGQNQHKTVSKMDTMKTEVISGPKMKVEVWSDIMCPFCYIGKRNYEAALAQFADSARVEIVWKSFQLDPTIPERRDKPTDVYEYLAERKGMSVEQSRQMHERVVQMARQAGLTYNFDKAVVANSFKAHRVIQLAKTKGLGDVAEERLFRAYFTEGQNFGDAAVLTVLGKEIGLTAAEVEEALSDEVYARKVEEDIAEARVIGVNGVPFFVFNRKYAISGAQPPAAFLQTLEKSFAEWAQEHPAPALEVVQGPSCTPEGECK